MGVGRRAPYDPAAVITNLGPPVCSAVGRGLGLGLAAFAALLLPFAGAARAQAPASAIAADAPAVAFHYGATPPIDELRAFDLVVLEPDHVPAPARLPAPTRWLAYVSVGEIDARRAYAKYLPQAWLRGENAAWNTRRVDHSAPGWGAFFDERVIAPLWQRGWRGFFLDTLDAHRAFAATPQAQRAQEDALVAMVERLHARFPGIELVFNRGFELMPRLRGKVRAVAAESLYRGWDVRGDAYTQVSAADRAWLLDRLLQVRREHGIPVIAIDYLPLAERALARETAARIRAHGIVPWVANGALDQLGVGDLEVQPRRVALITDLPPDTDFQNSNAYRLLAMPLHWLGYTIDPFDVRGPLPDHLLGGRHAAIVTWFSQPPAALNAAFPEWLRAQIEGGLRLVMFETPAMALDSSFARALGLARVDAGAAALRIEHQDPSVGFEAEPPRVLAGAGVQLRGAGKSPPGRPKGESFEREREGSPMSPPGRPKGESFEHQREGSPISPPGRPKGESFEREREGSPVSLLRLRGRGEVALDPVALAPWGGYALAPFALRPGALPGTARWIIDPIEFLRRALGAPGFPVPDVTTEAGRRLLLVHIDGDGFVSRAERPGAPFAGEVKLTDLLLRYRIPHTVSVVQGEISGTGLFRELAPALEDIARRIFALPHVEIASHSYSHPFFWGKLQRGADPRAAPRALNLMLPGYRFDLNAEIGGSIDYIDTRLAPPGKRTEVFLWTGDCVPTTEAVALADAAGVLNMNGGDTLITRSQPTLTLVSGLGLRRGAGLQVFAPNQNEYMYTNGWTGPFYGFQRVLETFELTESPRRLKPINLYYHTYSATKAASLNALHRVYGWALAQPVVPVYASDYIRKVLDFHRMAITRDWRAPVPSWRIRGDGALRTLRLPAGAEVALVASRQVAGVAPGPGARYVHLTAPAATLVLAPEAEPPVHVRDAAGWIEDFERDAAGIRFTLAAYATTRFSLGAARGCRVRVDGRELSAAARAGDDPITYELPEFATTTTPRRHRVDVRCGA